MYRGENYLSLGFVRVGHQRLHVRRACATFLVKHKEFRDCCLFFHLAWAFLGLQRIKRARPIAESLGSCHQCHSKNTLLALLWLCGIGLRFLANLPVSICLHTKADNTGGGIGGQALNPRPGPPSNGLSCPSRAKRIFRQPRQSPHYRRRSANLKAFLFKDWFLP